MEVQKTRGPKTDKSIVKDILFLKNQGLPPHEIRTDLLKIHKNEHIPEVRGIQKIIQRYKFKPSEKDDRWSLGSNADLGMPTHFLIKVQRMLKESGHFLTIRRAIWITRLYSLIGKKEKDVDTIKLFLISSIYCHREQMSEVMFEIEGKKALDTSDLDDKFIITDGLSSKTILEAWTEEFFPDLHNAKPKINETNIPSPVVALKNRDPKFDEWVSRLMEALYDHSEKAFVYLEKHPEIEESALKFVAFSTRQELTEYYLKDKKAREGG